MTDLLPALGVALTAVLAYLAATYKSRRGLKSTPAETLFASLGDELKANRAEVAELKTEIKGLKDVISSLQAEVQRLTSWPPRAKPKPRPRKAQR